MQKRASLYQHMHGKLGRRSTIMELLSGIPLQVPAVLLVPNWNHRYRTRTCILYNPRLSFCPVKCGVVCREKGTFEAFRNNKASMTTVRATEILSL